MPGFVLKRTWIKCHLKEIIFRLGTGSSQKNALSLEAVWRVVIRRREVARLNFSQAILLRGCVRNLISFEIIFRTVFLYKKNILVYRAIFFLTTSGIRKRNEQFLLFLEIIKSAFNFQAQ